jgi:hypothetical protein
VVFEVEVIDSQDATGMPVTVTVIEKQTEIKVLPVQAEEDEAGLEAPPVDISRGGCPGSPVRRGDHELYRHNLGNQTHP